MLGQALTAVALSAFWTVVASALVVTGLQIADWMCQASTAGDSASTFFGNVVKGLGAFAGAGAATGNAGAAGMPLFVGFIAAIWVACLTGRTTQATPKRARAALAVCSWSAEDGARVVLRAA